MSPQSANVKSPADTLAVEPRSRFHEAALEYARQGIEVFPCIPDSKKPLTDNGFKDATTDPAQIEAWWTKWPNANIAFTPHSQGWGIIDIDGKAGEDAWFELGLTHDTPETYAVRTPRGGLHLYYIGKLPTTAWAPGRKRCLGEHIDTRGEKNGEPSGYVLLPPSHVQDDEEGIDGEYTVIDDREKVPLPTWITEHLTKLAPTAKKAPAGIELDTPRNIERARHLLRTYVKHGKVAVEYEGGSNFTFQLACEVMDAGTTPETAFKLMRDEWNARCRPPWEPDELEKIVGNAARYQQNEPGSKARPPLNETFKEQARLEKAKADAMQEAEKDGLIGGRFRHTTGRDHAPKKTLWLWHETLIAGALTLVGGHGDVGKSTVLLDWAARLTTGAAWPDKTPNGVVRDVIYFGTEQNVQRTVMRKFLAAGGDRDRIHFLWPEPDDDGAQPLFNLQYDIKALTELMQKLRRQGRSVGAVIFDPLNTYIGEGDTSRNTFVRAVLTPLAAWAADHDIAVFGNGHVTKSSNSGRAVNRFLDSRGYTDIARGVFIVGEAPGNRKRRVIVCAKRNEGQREGGMHFGFDPRGVATDWETGEAIPTVKLAWNDAWDGMLDADAVMRNSDGADRKDGTAKDRIQEEARKILMSRGAQLTNKLYAAIVHECGQHHEKTIRDALRDMGTEPVPVSKTEHWTILPGSPMPAHVLDKWLNKAET